MATKTLELTIPPSKNTWATKIAFAIAALEAVRLDHNEMGQKFRDGIITPAEWEAYTLDVWHPRQNATATAVGALRTAPGSGDLSEVDLSKDFKDVTAVSIGD